MIQIIATGRGLAVVTSCGSSVTFEPCQFISNHKRATQVRAGHYQTAPLPPKISNGAGPEVRPPVVPPATPIADNDHPDSPPEAA